MPANQDKIIQQLSLLDDFEPADYEAWQQAAKALLKGKPFETLLTQTYEEITLKPIYDRSDFPDKTQPVLAMKETGVWQIAQENQMHDPEALNAHLRQDLAAGQTAIALMVPSSDERSHLNLEFLQVAFRDLVLNSHALLLQTGNGGLAFAGFLQALANTRRGSVALEELQGTLGSDPLGELAAKGELAGQPEIVWRNLTILCKWAQKTSPALGTITVDAGIYQEAGASAVQELACALATGVEYVRSLYRQDEKLTIDQIAPRLWFAFSQGGHYFMEIAKLRAARLLWAQAVAAFGGDAKSQKTRIHCRTTSCNKSRLDPHTNMLRATTEALSAVLGGCDSLSVRAFDGSDSDFARRLARNTQIILRDEVHLDKVLDPARGSWFVESLTLQLAEKGWELFQEIEKQGGMLKALQSGFIQEMIAEAAEKRRKNLQVGKDKLVGVNVYQPEESSQPAPAAPKEPGQSRSHSNETASAEMANLKKIADSGNFTPEELVSAIAEAAEAGGTFAGITTALAGKEGKSLVIRSLETFWAAEAFEVFADEGQSEK